MPFLQQIQSISSQTKWINESPAIPYIVAGAVILIEVIALIAGQIFALIATAALLTAIAMHLQDRTVTRVIAGALTIIIIAISLAALFPPYAPVAFGGALLVGGGCFLYTFFKVVTSPKTPS